MIDIGKLKKERGYEKVWWTVYEFPHYIAHVKTLDFKYIEFLVCKKTGKEYLKEKWFFSINIILNQREIWITKWWLTYKLDIDFKTLELKWVKRFID